MVRKNFSHLALLRNAYQNAFHSRATKQLLKAPLRGHTRRLDKRAAFQSSRLEPDTSVLAREALPSIAHGSVSPPSLVLCPTAPVYTDEMLAPTVPP